jgi:hypothetical protein
MIVSLIFVLLVTRVAKVTVWTNVGRFKKFRRFKSRLKVRF